MKKEVGSGVESGSGSISQKERGSGSAPKYHGSPTLCDFIYVQEMCKDDEADYGTRLIRKVCAILAAKLPRSQSEII
jgi:hypothetical protein